MNQNQIRSMNKCGSKSKSKSKFLDWIWTLIGLIQIRPALQFDPRCSALIKLCKFANFSGSANFFWMFCTALKEIFLCFAELCKTFFNSLQGLQRKFVLFSRSANKFCIIFKVCQKVPITLQVIVWLKQGYIFFKYSSI